jgi:hypothetical protein
MILDGQATSGFGTGSYTGDVRTSDPTVKVVVVPDSYQAGKHAYGFLPIQWVLRQTGDQARPLRLQVACYPSALMLARRSKDPTSAANLAGEAGDTGVHG